MGKCDFCVEEWLGHWHAGNLTHLHTGHIDKSEWQDDLSLGGAPCDYPRMWDDTWSFEEQILTTILPCRRQRWGSFLPTSLSCRNFLRDSLSSASVSSVTGNFLPYSHRVQLAASYKTTQVRYGICSSTTVTPPHVRSVIWLL